MGCSFVCLVDNKSCLCPTGDPDGTWNVDLPTNDLPPEFPEPCLGINFARDGMSRDNWLAFVAVHCDVWLLSIAFFYGCRLNADRRYARCSCWVSVMCTIKTSVFYSHTGPPCLA